MPVQLSEQRDRMAFLRFHPNHRGVAARLPFVASVATVRRVEQGKAFCSARSSSEANSLPVFPPSLPMLPTLAAVYAQAREGGQTETRLAARSAIPHTA